MQVYEYIVFKSTGSYVLWPKMHTYGRPSGSLASIPRVSAGVHPWHPTRPHIQLAWRLRSWTRVRRERTPISDPTVNIRRWWECRRRHSSHTQKVTYLQHKQPTTRYEIQVPFHLFKILSLYTCNVNNSRITLKSRNTSCLFLYVKINSYST